MTAALAGLSRVVKIVFLSPAAQGGGAEEVLFDLVAGLRKKQPAWYLHVICGEEGPLCERLSSLAVATEVVAFPVSFQTYGEQFGAVREGRFRRLARTVRAAADFVVYELKLRRRLGILRPDIIHSNGMKMHLASAFAAKRRVPVVWHLHDYISTRALTSRLLPRLSFRVSLVLANSRSVARDARNVLRGTRIEVLENAVDLARFQPAGPVLDLDGLSGLAPAAAGTIRVGLIGTFARWKGQDLFLRAIALLPRDLAARFYIIGGPVYATPGSQWTQEELAHLAAPVSGRVGFTGWVNDAAAAIRSLDVVVHASIKPEPFGLVIIQAAACGKAVVVSGEGGAGEVAAALPSAKCFAPRDPQSLADAMLKFILAQGQRPAAPPDGAVRERFDLTRMATQATEYFQNLAAASA
jgi:glycosyltransferase involved in cell wall biosynthesis